MTKRTSNTRVCTHQHSLPHLKMRLLNASKFTVHEFYGSNIPKYAILSHRWENEEVTFQDLRDGKGPVMAGWSKVTGCCAQAVLDGWEYVVSLCLIVVLTGG